jgi:hypothetical protein
MQKSLIVNDSKSVDELNKLLETGWRVVNTCPMPSSGSQYSSDSQEPTCLIIIEN